MELFREMPPSEDGKPVSSEDAQKIMHVSLPIGKETMIMGSDTGGEWAPRFIEGNNFNISLTTDSVAEADKLFYTLSKDGVLKMQVAKTFWGDYFGICTDQFGINRMFSFNENPSK